MRSAEICFLNAKNFPPIEIHTQIMEVYGDSIMNKASVRTQCIIFHEERLNCHNEKHSGQPSLVTEALKTKTDK